MFPKNAPVDVPNGGYIAFMKSRFVTKYVNGLISKLIPFISRFYTQTEWVISRGVPKIGTGLISKVLSFISRFHTESAWIKSRGVPKIGTGLISKVLSFISRLHCSVIPVNTVLMSRI